MEHLYFAVCCFGFEVGKERLYNLRSWCCEQLMVGVVGWNLVGDDARCLVVVEISN